MDGSYRSSIDLSSPLPPFSPELSALLERATPTPQQPANVAQRTDRYVLATLTAMECCLIDIPPSGAPYEPRFLVQIQRPTGGELSFFTSAETRAQFVGTCLPSFQKYCSFENVEQVSKASLIEYTLSDHGDFWIRDHVILNGVRATIVFYRDAEKILRCAMTQVGKGFEWVQAHPELCKTNVQISINLHNEYPRNLGAYLAHQAGWTLNDFEKNARLLQPSQYSVLPLRPTHYPPFPYVQVLLMQDASGKTMIRYFMPGDLAYYAATANCTRVKTST